MKKSYKLLDLDCAAKMEDAINKIDGIQFARIGFMAQRLTITADPEKQGEILKEAVRVCQKIGPDCAIVI